MPQNPPQPRNFDYRTFIRSKNLDPAVNFVSSKNNKTRGYVHYEHPRLRSLAGDVSESVGPGGLDFMMLGHMGFSLRNVLTRDQNFYDAAAWSAVVVLNEYPIRNCGDPLDFPDFTQESLENCAAAGRYGARR